MQGALQGGVFVCGNKQTLKHESSNEAIGCISFKTCCGSEHNLYQGKDVLNEHF